MGLTFRDDVRYKSTASLKAVNLNLCLGVTSHLSLIVRF